MDYQQFLNCVQKRVSETMGEEVDVEVRRVLKNNGCELDGLTIMRKESEGSPTIYLNGYYEQYMSGRSEEAIVREILQIYEINKGRVMICAADFGNFENIRGKIVFKLINYDANTKLLESVPYKRYLDLAVVFCVLVESSKDGSATALIYNAHLALWNVTDDEIYELAKKNTPVILPYTITRMDAFLDEELLEGQALTDAEYMYILSNKACINGASSMLYEGLLERFSQYFESDVIIIPSSIHEVILLPWNEQYNIQELNELVGDVNASIVDKEEMLANNVYIYSREEKITMIAAK